MFTQIRATSVADGLSRVIVAVDQKLGSLLVVDMDGRMSVIGIDEVIVDWRYDPRTERWTDLGRVDEDDT